MSLRQPFTSLRTRLILLFLLVASVPLLLAGGLFYQREVVDDRAEAFAKLEAIRSLKASRINAWIDEVSGDLADFAADAGAVLGVAAPRDRLRGRFESYLRTHGTLGEVLLLDGATGRVLLSTNWAHEGEDRASSQVFRDTVATGRPVIGDLHRSELTHAPRLSFTAPVRLPAAAAPVAAVVVGDVDLGELNTLLQDRTGMGDTGETLVVNTDVVAINELRHVQGAPLHLRIGAEPSVRAARGETGIVESADYRGVEVLAAYTFIPRTRWGLVAKQDLDEVYAPMRESTRSLLVLLAGSVVLVLVLGGFVARTVARPIHQLQATAEAIRGGRPGARNRLDRTDELGALANAFDGMADHLQAQLAVEEGSRAIVEAMVHPATLQDFCRELLQAALRATGSELGAVYLDDGAGRLVPAASQGLSAAALEPFDGLRREGALGAALAGQGLQHLRDVPADTRFTFRTLAGTAVPQALLAVPLLDRERVAAVLALGSLRPYPPAALMVLERSRVAMSIGLANLLASEETGRLARQLADRNAELQAQAAELESQASELHQQSGVLEQQNLELELQSTRVTEANRLKSEFLSNMSHELRTPLNSVLALSRVLQLQAQARLSEEETGYLRIIERNGKHLLDLINDILDLAKIESGRMEVAREVVSLPERIAAVVEGLEPLCREKGIGLVVELEPGLPALASDARKIHQILQNVVGNAVKFTQAGGVTVRARRRGPEVEVEVADTGIGIPAHALASIFDEFRQVDGSTSRSFEGTGLGLAIALKAARLLGGRISVVSTPGAGSTFTVALPVGAAAPDVGGQAPGAAALAGAPVDGAVLPGAPGPRPGRPPGRGGRLLLVEDSEPAILQIQLVLQTAGYQVDVARGGREALALMGGTPPDGIILDLQMPQVDGFAVLERLRGTPATAGVPVLILTAKDLTRADLSRLSANHVQQLVQKGDVDREQLLRQVALLLGRDPPAPAPAGQPAPPRGPAPRRPEAPAHPDRGAPVVLVVEDNPDNLVTLRAALGGRWTVLEARDGEEGLALALRHLPDLVLLDMALPRLDGLAVLARLRAHPVAGGLRVVALTAHAMAGDRERLLAAGCDDYLAKPLELDRLLEVVERLAGPGGGGEA